MAYYPLHGDGKSYFYITDTKGNRLYTDDIRKAKQVCHAFHAQRPEVKYYAVKNDSGFVLTEGIAGDGWYAPKADPLQEYYFGGAAAKFMRRVSGWGS